jgi:hypothetical protein
MRGTYHGMARAFVLDPLRAKEKTPLTRENRLSERTCVIVVLACKPILQRTFSHLFAVWIFFRLSGSSHPHIQFPTYLPTLLHLIILSSRFWLVRPRV